MRQYKRLTKEELENVIKGSISYAEALRKLGRKPVGGSITNIALICKRFNISTDHMLGQSHRKGKSYPRNIEQVKNRLTVGTSVDRRISSYILRRALLDSGTKHECAYCNIQTWNGEPLVLEIDHINEKYWDNTLDNLQFLCPNCHSIKTKHYIENKKASLSQLAEETCLDHVNVLVRIQQEVPKKASFTKEILEKLVWQLPITSIGKKYNMSDNGIRRWVKRWKITTPPRGYFLRGSSFLDKV